MDNREIAAAFDEIADLLEFQGANPFRVRAYRNAARTIGALSEPLAAVAADAGRELTGIEGIGKDLAEKIVALLATGRLPQLDELRQQVSPGVLALLRVPGLGPKKAATLHRELGVQSLAELRDAAQQQRIRGLKGFGAKTEEAILKGLAIAEQAFVRLRRADAEAIVGELLDHMRGAAGVRRSEIAGSFRRGRETVGDLDLLVDCDDAAPAMDRLAAFPPVAEVIARGDTKMSVRLQTGVQVDLRVVPAQSYGAALQYFTGSKEHNVVVRGMAKERGLKVNEWGVFRSSGAAEGDDDDSPGDYVAGRTEQDVYAAIGLPWFPPEIREGRDEFSWAARGELPRLVELADLCGDLHMHTTASDGTASLREMADEARARGLQYIAITDHSQRVSMAGGLDAARLRAQWQEIDRLRAEVAPLGVLKGIECDILERGGMDLPDDVLAEADWVIASVHYGQNQSRQQITERILQAIENPHVDIVAHPTGRLINRREAYQVDLDAVFDAAARHGKMLELNANPMRLDLDDIHCAAAKRRGIKIAINSDAHSPAGMDVLRHGVLQARRAGLTPGDVANARSWSKFRKLLTRG